METADLVTFTEKIFNGKLHFLCSVTVKINIAILKIFNLETFKISCDLKVLQCRQNLFYYIQFKKHIFAA